MRVNSVEMTAGAFVVATGGFFSLGALGYNLGTAARMGPGYFPLLTGILTLLIGVAICCQSLFIARDSRAAHWRPLIFIVLAIGLFGLTVERLGLIPSSFLVVMTSSAGSADVVLGSTLALACVVSLCAWLIFGIGLNLPLPAFAGL